MPTSNVAILAVFAIAASHLVTLAMASTVVFSDPGDCFIRPETPAQPGKNVVYNCTTLAFEGGVIDVQGTSGVPFSNCSDTGGLGAHGYPGLPGHLGGPAGNVTIYAFNITGTIKIDARGGQGGQGQCGGKGGQGLPGTHGVSQTDCSCGCGGIGSCDSCHVNGGSGSQGQPGGIGGVGGTGGLGGHGGLVNIYSTRMSDIDYIYTQGGAAGGGGVGGAAGTGGTGGGAGMGWTRHACNRCASGVKSGPCCPGIAGPQGDGGTTGPVGGAGQVGADGTFNFNPYPGSE